MQDYLDVFARFKNKENIEAVERLLTSHHELENFEKSQLGMADEGTEGPTDPEPALNCSPLTAPRYTTGTLCCETADEAKTLIPSLANKISDADLQDLLDEISKLRQFTE